MVLLSPVKTLIYSIAFLSLAIFMPKLQTSLTRSALHLASISVKPITQRIPPFTIIPPPGRIATRISGISLPFALFSSSSKASAGEDKMGGEHAVKKSDTEWRAVLSPEQFRVLRKQGTEAPGSHAYDKKSPSDKGVYHCAGCDAPLYTSNTKFKSGCGWPAFYDTIPGAVDRHEDTSMFMKRIEITCHNCGGHLGHVFQGEGYQTPTDERHCVNGISLNFKDEK